MNTLAEIEAAAAALPPKQQRQLLERLAARLATARVPARLAKGRGTDPLAGIRAHRQRMLALTHGQPILTQKEWKRVAKAIRGE